jgi:hypothetical protein
MLVIIPQSNTLEFIPSTCRGDRQVLDDCQLPWPGEVLPAVSSMLKLPSKLGHRYPGQEGEMLPYPQLEQYWGWDQSHPPWVGLRISSMQDLVPCVRHEHIDMPLKYASTQEKGNTNIGWGSLIQNAWDLKWFGFHILRGFWNICIHIMRYLSDGTQV